MDFEREFPPKCSWEILLLIQLNWVIAFLLHAPHPAELPSVIVLQNVIILYSFPTPVFHGIAGNESLLHFGNTKARKN